MSTPRRAEDATKMSVAPEQAATHQVDPLENPTSKSDIGKSRGVNDIE